MTYEKKLIEGRFPCRQVGAETKRERGASSALPPLYFLHVWWARRPLTPSRAAVLGSILPAETDPELFLQELGIRKYQVDFGGIKIDIPKKFVKENGTEFSASESLYKLFEKENKLRSELRDVISQMCSLRPSIVENEAVKKLMERARHINMEALSPTYSFFAVEVPADPAWFNDVMGICVELGIRIPNLYGYARAYSNAPTKQYDHITVLDPTAGGGSIPFEATRLGCNVIANDLNPVASVIEMATVRYPAMFGTSLLHELNKYGSDLVKVVSEKLSNVFYPMHEKAGSSEDIMSYLFCRTVTCPNCGERAPLLNAFALQKKNDGWMVLPEIDGIKGHRKVHFRPVPLKSGKGPHGEDPEKGSVKNGVGTCLHCSQAISSKEIKRQARGESEYGTWSDELYCVVAVREQPKLDKSGKVMTYASGVDKGKVRTEQITFFREPTQADFDALKRAEQALQENWSRWETMDLIPTEKIPEGHKTTEPRNIGIERWCDMFTPRQLLGHLTAMEALHDMIPEILESFGRDKGTAIVTYLQYMIDKCLDYNSRQTRWEYTRSVIKGTFGRHDFSLKWTFGEMIATGLFTDLAWGKEQIIDAYSGICDLISESTTKPATVLNGSAANLDIRDSSVDVICVDPPYYNNVQYAELSDYFYVWQKRTFRDLYPDLFGRRLTNKTDEAVANPVRDGSVSDANKSYELRMSEIFIESRRVLKDDGVLSMMFTHKTQEAWETLTKALIESGWIISSSFPVDSEADVSMHQKGMAAAASSIFLACRKRGLSDREPSLWSGFGGKGVAQQVREAVRQGLADYSMLHLNAVDEMVASYGCALRVLSENWPVIDGETLVSPITAMREASTVVAQHQMTRLTDGRLGVTDVEAEAGIALTLFGIYGIGWLPFDDALSISKSLNIRLDNRSGGYKNDGHMIGINSESSLRSAREDEQEGFYAPLVSKGSKLRLALPEERNPRRLENPQSEWDVLHGLIIAYREGDMPVARAYLQKQAEGKEQKIIDILKVWADGCESDDMQKEAERILFSLK